MLFILSINIKDMIGVLTIKKALVEQFELI